MKLEAVTALVFHLRKDTVARALQRSVEDDFGEVGVARQSYENFEGFHHGSNSLVGTNHLHLRTNPRPPAPGQV